MSAIVTSREFNSQRISYSHPGSMDHEQVVYAIGRAIARVVGWASLMGRGCHCITSISRQRRCLYRFSISIIHIVIAIRNVTQSFRSPQEHPHAQHNSLKGLCSCVIIAVNFCDTACATSFAAPCVTSGVQYVNSNWMPCSVSLTASTS